MDADLNARSNLQRGAERSGSWNLYDSARTLTWSGIVAGAVVALGVQLILTLLGMGIAGINANPASEPGRVADGMAIGAAIWLLISGVIAFGCGGFVAGHVSGTWAPRSGMLHGALAWALAAVIGASVAAMAGSTAVGGAAAGLGAAARTAPDQTRTSLSTQVRRDGTGLDNTAPMSEAEARAAAERTADAAGKTALWTGIAFLASMIAAAAGGAIGHKSHQRSEREDYVPRHARPASA